jgi:hypothetical protein
VIGYDGKKRARHELASTREVPLKLRFHWSRICILALAFALVDSQAFAAAVTHIQVRVVTGADELTAGSLLELRIYETGRAARHLPLTHGEAWPRDSTRIIPLALTEPLDPRLLGRLSPPRWSSPREEPLRSGS